MGFFLEVAVTRNTAESENTAMPDIILYPRDTVMRALEVMHRYGVHLLPVVDERRGEVLGHVSEEELYRLCPTLPLVSMAELLTARAGLGSEGIAAARPARVGFIPLERTASPAWLH